MEAHSKPGMARQTVVVVVVVGGLSGIGRAVAERAAAEGARVVAAGHVTLSIGVACVGAGSAPGGGHPGGAAVEAAAPLRLVEAADQALYASKTGGRNRATLAPPLRAAAGPPCAATLPA